MSTSEEKNNSTPCVIRDSAMAYAQRVGLAQDSSPELEDCRIVESMRKLLMLGLSTDEIDDLDIRQPILQTICEYARLDDCLHQTDRAARAVEATLRAIADQIRNIDLEIEMLDLRKRALEKRTRLLEKLAAPLRNENNDLLAA